MSSDFAMNMFPVSATVGYAVPNFDITPGNTTSLSCTIDVGYVSRSLIQDPQTGDYLEWDIQNLSILSDGTIVTRDQVKYSVLYSSWQVKAAQGVGYSPVAKQDLFTFSLSYNVRWEQAWERLAAARNDWYAASNLLLFTGPVGPDDVMATRPAFTGMLRGAPDLQGNRYMLSTYVEAAIAVNLKRKTHTTSDGIDISLVGRWAPWWLFNSISQFDGRSDYWSVSFTLSGSYTLLQIPQANGWNAFSLVLDDELVYRYLDGPKIPRYAQYGGIWKASAQNLEHSITNSLKLYMYGPHFFADSCIPYLYTFLDLGLTGGTLNNNDIMSYRNTVGSVGVHVHLQLFNILHMYYEVGYVFGPERNAAKEVVWPGIFGIYVTLW